MASLTADQLLSAFRDQKYKQEAIRLLSAFPDKSEIKNIKDRYSYYLIHWAAQHGWTEIVELLVTTYYCDPSCTTSVREGETSLHWACLNDHLPTVKLLTTQFCQDPLQTNSFGRTSLRFSSGETKEFLQQIIGKCVCLYVYCLYICHFTKVL